jgi:hypothetical protein
MGVHVLSGLPPLVAAFRLVCEVIAAESDALHDSVLLVWETGTDVPAQITCRALPKK